jgi:two-component system sensor histidine kinase GlrK
MKIATRIAAGYGVLMAVVIVLLVYHLSLIRQMRSINEDLSKINFKAAETSLQLEWKLKQVVEFTRKFFIRRDPAYAALLDQAQADVAKDLQLIKSVSSSEREQAEIMRLSQVWDEFAAALTLERPAIPMTDPEGVTPMPAASGLSLSLTALIDQLQVQAQKVSQATQQAIQIKVNQSNQTVHRAERISFAATATAIFFGLVVSWLIVRSIARPLRQLTDGTRAIAEGNFFYQLDATGKDEFAELAKDFNTMAHRLNELDEMKKDLVAHVSHELKAPLASIQEAIQVLLEEIPGPLSDKQKRLLELNLQSVRRLSAMIGNLLDLSRMEAGVVDYEFELQDLVTLLQDVVEEYETKVREKNLRIETDFPAQPVVVECDHDRVIQVVGNLLENAFKFSPKGSAIRVGLRFRTEVPDRLPPAWHQSISAASNGEGFALVTVIDSGPGVPDSHKERIFEKFHQVKQGKKMTGQGVGLGLAICRTIVAAHHGAIWVEDNPKGGSIFTLLLPVGAAADRVEYTASTQL